MSWHYDGKIRIKKLETEPFGTNCYIVSCPQSGEGVVVDSPGEAATILAEAEELLEFFGNLEGWLSEYVPALERIRQSALLPVEA